MLSGRRNRTQPHPIDRIVSWLGRLEEYCGKPFGKRLKASAKCTGCSWCTDHCPRSNIVMIENKPVFGGNCTICLRCVYGCPQKAVVPGLGKFLVLKDGYDLKKVENHMEPLTDHIPVSQIARGYLFKGVRNYLDVKDTMYPGKHS